nr:MAG TPA: zinc-ribbon domain protein [Caudoviricetes sp.]
MADYIRREDARRMVVQLDKYAWKSPASDERRVTVDVDLVKFGLDRIPAADVAEVVHGEWLRADDDWNSLTTIQCSLCSEEWCFETDDDVSLLNYKYCPNCGAKMDGGDGSAAD